MKQSIYLLILFLLVLSCSSDDSSGQAESDWLIDSALVVGELSLYPLMSTPRFESVSSVELPNEALVGLVNFGNEIRVYPYFYTNSFEVVNEVFREKKIAVSYCPITKSGICFDRDMGPSTPFFRAAG